MTQHTSTLPRARANLEILLARHLGADKLKRLAMAGLILLTLAAAYWLGPRASTRYLLLLAAVPAGLFLLSRPQWGLVLLIPAGLVVPFAVGTGTQTEVPVTLLLLGALLAVWVVRMILDRDLRLASTPANLPLLALIVVAGFALVAGQAYWNPLVGTKSSFLFVQLAQWSVFILSGGAFWLMANLVRDVRWLRWMVYLFLALGVVYIATRLLPGSWGLTSRLFASGSTGSLFWVWLVALTGGQVLANRRLDRLQRLAFVGLLAATLGVAWFQGRDWVSGWAPPLVALLVIVWLSSPRAGALVTAGLAAVTPLAYPHFYENVVLRAMQTGSFLRLDAWRGIMQLVGNRWPLGLGLAAYWHYWRELIGTWAYTATNVVRNPQVNSHSNYVDIYAQMGILGLAVFLWVAISLWRHGWQVRKIVPDGFERGYVYGCLGGLAGSLAAGFLGDWFTPFVYNIGLAGMRASVLGWLFLGGLVSLAQLSQAARHGN
ncbi:MAG: hypothetical protein JXM73_21080 [Anaerolineae bacterium]|nr:hypothetical protein [Anaerolineae bacterium]